MEANIKTILLAVQQRLAERVPELAYIDKNWGQLDYEAPPVKWPCALLDIDEVPFSQIGGGGQIADGVTVEILAANLRRPPHPARPMPIGLSSCSTRFTRPSSASPTERSARCSARRSRRSPRSVRANVTRSSTRPPTPCPACRRGKAPNCRHRPSVWR